MAAEHVVIVGAGPAGLATARAYRDCGGTGSVTMIGAESRVPYQRPPLTKEYLRGELDAGQLPIESGDWFQDHDVGLRLGVRVAEIDPDRGLVTIAHDDVLSADAIVLASGSRPVRPDLPGIEDARVLTMRTQADSEALAHHIAPGARAIVIGTGFIGCEIAASLALREMRVTLVGQERLPQLERLGDEAGRRIAGWLEDLGVELVGEAEVAAVEDARIVELRDGRRLDASVVVLGTGVRPCGELAEAAGVPVEEGAVVVDEAMRCAGRPALLAVGDVAYAHNATAGRHLKVEHWGDALAHGKVAGSTLAGVDACWDGVPGFWSQIGEHTLKYAAWGEGHDDCRLVEHGDGAFTVWYVRDGATVGVLTHDRDEDYQQGSELIGAGASSS